MKASDILVIDDEEQLRLLLRVTLKTEGAIVREAQNGKKGLAALEEKLPDLILLDLGLPDMSGHQVLKTIRASYTLPVIILSVHSSEDEIVKALDNGANDYLVKPFRSGELLARIRACLRKTGVGVNEKFTDGDLQVDLGTRTVKRKGELVKLTITEYNLLALLVKNQGKVLTHQFLLRSVWGPGYIDQTQYLRVFVAQLRKKIEKEPELPQYILTESGLGYRFVIE